MPTLRRVALLTTLLLPLFAAAWPVFSGEATTESQQHLLSDIKYLASDELEGRGVGTKGLDLAADYIRDQFAKAGLNVVSAKGEAFQKFKMTTSSSLTGLSLFQSNPEPSDQSTIE